ncbi:MAG: UDP-N-acetylglucosamine 2-epimerase (non-hydrolyzing) [Alphaproteobacteria bacterium]|nr:UDP-N-acetylglucosamine 2-epimerase (non-hydrolyzing) [Alphaproteobacteria bacterium]
MKKTSPIRPNIVSIIGTRPEAIKFLPILRALERRAHLMNSRTIITSQHTDLIDNFIASGALRVDFKADVARPRGGLNEFLAGAIAEIDVAFDRLKPDFVLVQGDTGSTLAGALAAFNRRIPVGHVEAGLRSLQRDDPFPEEVNRRMVSQLASLHFTATRRNTETLLAEGIEAGQIVETGNTVVDALLHTLATARPSPETAALLDRLSGKRILTVTCHRRENHGDRLTGMLRALRGFTLAHPDVALVFPVHPNPAVRAACDAVFPRSDAFHLVAPMDHTDFIHLLRASWLIASDSGGVQEEAPSLGKGLLVLRDSTERQEVIEAGHARLVGTDPVALRNELEEAYAPHSWITRLSRDTNPFGNGDAATRIVSAIEARMIAALRIAS